LNMERFPTDLVVTLDDFRNSGWLEVVNNVADKSRYSDYWESFSKAARTAMTDEEYAKGKVLWLIADVCSMMLRPESVNEPFSYGWEVLGKRSANLEGFSESDISFFETILPELDDFRLKARIADLLWLVKKPRKVEYALCAIDSYQQFPLDIDNLLSGGKEAWRLAIKLALSLNKGAADRIKNICNSLFSKFQEADFSGGFHALWMSDFLEIIYLEEERSKDVVAKLEAFAQNANSVQDWHYARGYYEGAIRWCKRIGNESDIHRLSVELAETFVSEAEQKNSGENPSNMAAGHFLECAIQAYRKIPKKERAAYKVDERLEELHKRMNHSNKLSLEEMNAIETPLIDISQSIEASRNYVAGRNFPEVLIAFANIHTGTKVDEIRETVRKNMQHSILRQFFTSTHMTQDGRIAARSPGVNVNDMDSPETQKVLWQEMVQHYGLQVGLIVQAKILPALHVINAEHQITESILAELCRSSHIIPQEREGLWAKGLFFGFDNDFIVSTHLLTPQLGHLVRILMKQNGIKTTTLDSNGIETENGLSTLLGNPDIGKTMDKNLIFEFKALLADPIEPNLRNEVAHGLIEADGAMSVYAIYLWWLCLRLGIKTILWKRPNYEEIINDNG